MDTQDDTLETKDRPRSIMPQRRPHHVLRVVLVIAAVGLAVWIWDANKYRIFPKRFGVVRQGSIYRSGQIHADLVEKTLRKHDIQVVVSLVGQDPNDINQQAEMAAVEKLDIDLKCYPLLGDGTGDLENYVKAIEAMVAADRARKPVLVHCAAGAQRTGGAVAFYRLLVEGRDPDAVYRELRHYDWRDKPGHPLLPYLNENMALMAERLVEQGIIDEIPDPLPRLTGKHTPQSQVTEQP
jgi:protein-tyrosine phosphatase